MTALTGASNAVQGFILLLPLIVFIWLAFWRLHPVLFMIAGAISLITGFYMADIISNGATSNISITASLGLFILWLTCWALAFWAMFNPLKERSNE